MRFHRLLVATVLSACACGARADLISHFDGFNYVSEIGVSGLVSSYSDDSRAGKPLSGETTASVPPLLGPDRVSYPSGIGPVPSPGGSVGLDFDQGMLGTMLEAESLTIRLATAIDPQSGRYNSAWRTWYGQGDLFIDVADSSGVSHFALLSAWARGEDGDPVSVNQGQFNSARRYHVSGGPDDSSLEGRLVALDRDSDVVMVGGRGAYTSHSAPEGLDMRAYVRGGEVLADGGLSHATVSGTGRDWYVQTWSVDLGLLSDDPTFDVALHSLVTCGNDQIAMSTSVPEPASLLLLLLGVALVSRRRARR